jgi:hypothetical protein
MSVGDSGWFNRNDFSVRPYRATFCSIDTRQATNNLTRVKHRDCADPVRSGFDRQQKIDVSLLPPPACEAIEDAQAINGSNNDNIVQFARRNGSM